MKISFVLFVLAISINLFGQKHKDKTVEFKHVKGPLTPIEGMNFQYNFTVEEENQDVTGKKTILTVRSGSMAYDPRSNFYNSTEGLTKINGFSVVNYKADDEEVNHLRLKVGIVDVVSKDAVPNGTLPNSVTTILCYQMKITVPMELRFLDQHNQEFYNRSTTTDKTTYTYKFPEDYKPTGGVKGYTTTTELESVYQTHRINFLMEVRNQIVKKWIYETKMDISSHFTKQITDAKVDVSYVKDKKNDISDIEKLVVEMDTLFAQLDRQPAAGIGTNWHTIQYKEKFQLIAAGWENILNAENEKITNKTSTRFDSDTHEGFYRNFLWCKFFAGEMNFVLEKIIAIEDQRKINPNKYYAIKYDNMLKFIEDYQKRYLANKTAYGWE